MNEWELLAEIIQLYNDKAFLNRIGKLFNSIQKCQGRFDNHMDLFQTAAVAVLEKIREGTTINDLKGYLYRAARNMALDACGESHVYLEDLGDLPDDHKSRSNYDKYYRKRMRNAVKLLVENDSEMFDVFQSVYVDRKKTIEEMALQMKVKKGALYKRLERLRGKLREMVFGKDRTLDELESASPPKKGKSGKKKKSGQYGSNGTAMHRTYFKIIYLLFIIENIVFANHRSTLEKSGKIRRPSRDNSKAAENPSVPIANPTESSHKGGPVPVLPRIGDRPSLESRHPVERMDGVSWEAMAA
jgi:RNA polymerase sigma factor (sigma-70 family)